MAIAVGACGSGDETSTSNSEASSGSAAAPTDAVTSTAANAATTTAAPAASADRVMGGSLVLGVDAEAACLIPSLCASSAGPFQVRVAVMEYLAIRSNNDAGWEPQLAESIVASADLKAHAVTLKHDLRFSDGTPLTAQVVKEFFDTHVLVEGSLL